MNTKRTAFFTLILFLASLTGVAQKTQKIYLSGTDKDHTVDWDFFCTAGRKSGSWTKIPVPSNWELQGFGVYNYGHDKVRGQEEGLYKHNFSVPNLNGKRVLIVFEGSMTDTEVKINGKLAGPIHQGAFYEFKYDITDLVNANSSNLLEAKVSKQSANFSVNQAERVSDFWIFGGIFRPVYLEIVPQQYIERTAINAKMDGSFTIDVYTEAIKNANRIEAQISTLDGKLVGKAFSSSLKSEKSTLSTKIVNPTLWNPEKPYLYKVEVKLKKDITTLHSISEKFGFRTVELRKRDGFYVNDQKIRFKGVNRHSFYPASGRTTSKALSIRDVNLMKDMNMNAVRMSHYPPDKHFLDVCDSLGLFVLDELTGWQKAYDTEVGKKLVKELVVRDVNHPSIVLWDNGNEGGNNLELVDEYAKYDPQNRNVIHPWELFRGIDTRHYKPYNCCFDSHFNGPDVFFPTEFQHGMFDGGHGAGLNDYWNLMMQNPLSAGGFLWVFADEAVVRTDSSNVLDADGTHGPDGIIGPYGEKEGSFYAIKEIWSPVYISQKTITPDFRGTLVLENRYHFTNLNTCKFSWKLVNLSSPNEAISKNSVKSGKVVSPNIEPGRNGSLSLNLPSAWKQYDALYLTANDGHGRELFTWTWQIKSPDQIAQKIVTQIASGKASAREDEGNLYLSANGVEVKFDKNAGLLSGVKNARSSISLSNGPVLADLTSEFKSIKHYQDGNNYVVEMIYTGNFRKVIFTMLQSGWLKLHYEYLPTTGNYEDGTFDYLGVNFNYPEEKVTGVKYMGRGPFRVWKNRMKGMQFGVWEKAYNNTMTGYTWQYPEFKGYHSDFYWAVLENKEYPITIVSGTENLFLRLFTPEMPLGLKDSRPNYVKNTTALFPKGNISFMHAISPIGNKFMGADKTGPEGQRSMYSKAKREINQEGTLYFDFGAGVK